MVSPADGWDDTDLGYEKGDTSITVTEVEGEYWDGDEGGEYSGYRVVVRIGEPGYASPKEVATYEDPRQAWELAHLLTHLFNSPPPNKSLLSRIRREEHDDALALPIPGLTKRNPEPLLREALGQNEFYLDEVLS